MPNLIGTGNNQVPTNGMLGGLAYQSPDNVVIKTLELTNLAGHNSVIPSNAVDVFVYDTRKDSDGGAWRKRTQHTSWYNETLNTATRGSRRDFPAVAVIVATTTSVTIYDGDEPDMPMWMVFQSSGYGMSGVYMFNAGNVVNSSIYALNGILVGGQYQGTDTYGSPVINFISEKVVRMDANTTEGGLWLGNIADRNSSKGYASQASTGQGYLIVDSRINDVAMTVLPNAPIDSTTGLPVPTIAVATAGGVSVIKDDGTVANINPADSRVVTFDKNNGLWINFASGGSGIGWYYYTNFTSTSSFSSIYHNNSGWSASWDMLSGVYYRGISYGYSSLTTGTLGLSNFDGLGSLKAPTTMSNFITTTYNTGWMHGDIKGAWLSDTSTASVTGTELITNGDGTTTTGWTAGGGNTLTVTGGNFKCTTNINDGAYFGQGISVVSGKTYVMQATIVSDGTSKSVRMYLGGSVGSSGYAINQEGNVLGGIATIYWTATFTGTAYLWFYGSVPTSGTYILVDNISVRIAEPDRSVNNKGLAVYGTITKTAVATGADLVGYGGFSTSNYLEQPYNSSISMNSTDSLCIMAWTKLSSASNYSVIFASGGVTNGRGRYLYTYFGVPTLDTYGGAGNQGTRSIADGNWHHLVGIYRPSGGQIYVDGQLFSSPTWSQGYLDQNTTTYPIRVGIDMTLNPVTFHQGSIALLRVSNSIPSPEQITKIYNDEKALFQPNSQCTLYGSSDAVTALAYDDSYSTLLVGTSSGRSDFRGLERINNTTTAVTTAISASNGLIAEQ